MNKLYGLLLLVATAAAALLVFVPLQRLQPFKPQTADDVAVAYTLGRWGPLASLVLLALGAAFLALLWKRSSWWLRAPATVLALLLAAASYATHVNVYERFFAPLEETRLASVAEAGLEDDDMVLGVVVEGEARAYPVGILAYHHVVNDVVAGQPLAVTY